MIITLSGKIVGGNRLVINDNINVFLATQSNLWNNANNWSLGVIPSQNQTAIIRANCTVNTNFTVKNLTVEDTRTISFNAFTGTVNFDFTCNGNLNQAGFNSNLVLNGINNSVTGTFTSGTSSTITYSRNGNQNVLNLSYNNLILQNTGIKTLLGGIFTVSGLFRTTGTNGGSVVKSTSGDLICVGLLIIDNFSSLTVLDNVEIRGGLQAVAINGIVNCSNLKVTTNNQNANVGSGFGITLNGNLYIDNGITFTNNINDSNGIGFSVNGIINGGNAASTLINSSTGALYLLVNHTPMAIGVFTQNGTMGYLFNGNFTIPYGTFVGLTIRGTGTKTLSQNTTLSGKLLTGSSTSVLLSVLELSNYNLIVTTTSELGNGASITRTGTGNILFTGNVLLRNASFISVGANPIEFRNGVLTSNLDVTITASVVNFTTNNQSITGAHKVIFMCNIQIATALTITISNSNGVFVNGILNGSTATSILDNRSVFEYTNDAVLMPTGQFKTDQAINTVIYNKVSTLQTIRIPDDANYRNLTLIGNTSTKTVGGSGTVNVKNTRTINTGVTVVGTITNIP